MRPLVASHVQDVAESAGGDHPDLGALALDHHIRGYGRAVQDHVDVARRDARAPADLDNALNHANRLIRRRGRDLVHKDLLTGPRYGLFEHNVRERSPYIHSNSDHLHALQVQVARTSTSKGKSIPSSRRGYPRDRIRRPIVQPAPCAGAFNSLLAGRSFGEIVRHKRRDVSSAGWASRRAAAAE